MFTIDAPRNRQKVYTVPRITSNGWHNRSNTRIETKRKKKSDNICLFRAAIRMEWIWSHVLCIRVQADRLFIYYFFFVASDPHALAPLISEYYWLPYRFVLKFSPNLTHIYRCRLTKTMHGLQPQHTIDSTRFRCCLFVLNAIYIFILYGLSERGCGDVAWVKGHTFQ